MPKYIFEQVKIFGQKSGKCAVCGKRAKISTSFSQTINPFNKRSDGTQKSRADIMEELKAERADWLKTPNIHQKCWETSNS